MLATLERPLDRSVRATTTSTAVTRRTLVGPPRKDCPTALLPQLPAVSEGAVRPLPLSGIPTPPSGRPRPQVTRSEIRREVALDARPHKLRMTVRARRLLAGLALLLSVGVGVVAVDLLSAVIPDSPASSYPGQVAPYDSSSGESGPAGLLPASASSVVVTPGDTLWSLAQRVDPDADPRSVVAAIMTANGLTSPSIQAGQVLRLP